MKTNLKKGDLVRFTASPQSNWRMQTLVGIVSRVFQYEELSTDHVEIDVAGIKPNFIKAAYKVEKVLTSVAWEREEYKN